ncbi:hypothetical protein BDR04DRAFT_1089734 [Suillus decipiens]|nr:hypothetical protein BDR04DRAFT_1089734 [Suillus decipiens]
MLSGSMLILFSPWLSFPFSVLCHSKALSPSHSHSNAYTVTFREPRRKIALQILIYSHVELILRRIIWSTASSGRTQLLIRSAHT